MRRSPPSKYDDAVIPAKQSGDREIRSEQELAVTLEVGTSLSSIQPTRRMELAESKVQNFGGRNELDIDGRLKKIGRGQGRCGIGEWMSVTQS
jgi:hypothetical protein